MKVPAGALDVFSGDLPLPWEPRCSFAVGLPEVFGASPREEEELRSAPAATLPVAADPPRPSAASLRPRLTSRSPSAPALGLFNVLLHLLEPKDENGKLMLLKAQEDIEEVSQGASKELNVEMKLREIEEQWTDMAFNFSGYKSRNGVFILRGGEVAEMQEILEESLMNLGGMASSRYAMPFKEDVDLWLAKLSESSEVIEQWLYLQMQV